MLRTASEDGIRKLWAEAGVHRVRSILQRRDPAICDVNTSLSARKGNLLREGVSRESRNAPISGIIFSMRHLQCGVPMIDCEEQRADLWFEKRGRGEPFVLLHPGVQILVLLTLLLRNSKALTRVSHQISALMGAPGIFLGR